MRHLTLVRTALAGTLLAGAAWGQTMVEFGSAAAGGSVAGASGKKVSDGITAVFGKVNGTTDKAAASGKPAAGKQQPALEVSSGVPKDDGSGVPAPPETHTAVRKAAPELAPVITVAEVAPVAPPPPPPQMTAENLKQVAPGASREDLLKLGAPSARITMIDDGHLVEVYNYIAHGENLGRVRLTDGAVASVQAH